MKRQSQWAGHQYKLRRSVESSVQRWCFPSTEERHQQLLVRMSTHPKVSVYCMIVRTVFLINSLGASHPLLHQQQASRSCSQTHHLYYLHRISCLSVSQGGKQVIVSHVAQLLVVLNCLSYSAFQWLPSLLPQLTASRSTHVVAHPAVFPHSV